LDAIGAGKLTIENGLLGQPNIKVTADAETWLGFLAGARPPRALIARSRRDRL